MTTSITFDEALAYMHPMEDLDEVKKNLISPKDIARDIWTWNKEYLILRVRNTLKDGGYKYHFPVSECNDEIVSYLKAYLEEEFKPSGACIYYEPPCVNKEWSCLVVDYTNLNRELVIQMERENRERADNYYEKRRKTKLFIQRGMILGSIALVGAAMYLCW
jgi:hypothetical protein